MPRRLHILTFGSRPLYLSRLARSGHRFDVVRATGGAVHRWMEAGDLPANATVIEPVAARVAAERARYDLAVCHSLDDLRRAASLGLPSATVFHAPRDLEAAFGLTGAALGRAAPLLESTRVVYPSAFVRDSWPMAGTVIEPGLDAGELPEHEGGEARLLVVASLVRELPWLAGRPAIEEVTAGFPVSLHGFNPSIAGCRPAHRRSEMREARRRHRAYLAVAPAPWHDPLDAQLLEAMAAGMPVIATRHYAPVVTDGVSGIIGDDPRALRRGILELFDDRERALSLGRAGRASIARRFPMARFLEGWNQVWSGLSLDRS